jgi:class 3 adenylate cyclase
MTAARRLAAILAADVVGYSRLMGEDQAGTAKIVRERREAAAPIVAAHGGRVFKTMGDGILIEFASVVAAVECALAMQKQAAERNAEAPEAKSVVYRIGVHLGDVLVDGEDVLGDGVNIATRLEGVAEPGGVCVSGSAFDHVRGRVEAEFIDLGERALKNIARPVRVCAVKFSSGNAELALHSPTLEKSGPPHFSIVVLPFVNLGGDPEQEYFADGVTESLTTAYPAPSSSGAQPPFPTKANRPISSRSGASSTCAMCSKAACSVLEPGCGSTCS